MFKNKSHILIFKILICVIVICACCGCGYYYVQQNQEAKRIAAEEAAEAERIAAEEEAAEAERIAAEEAAAEAERIAAEEAAEAERIAAEEAAVAEPEVITFTLSAVGDCALGPVQVHTYDSSITQYYDLYGADYFFKNVRSIFLEDDLTIVNLECVLTTETERVEKTWNIKGLPEYTSILTGSGVEICSFANNHNADYGEQSTIDTIEALEAADLGYYYNEYTYTYITDEGFKIGMVAANVLTYTSVGESYLFDGIASLKDDGCDIIIASVHWGEEYEHIPSDYQISLAHQLVDAGVNLILGAHSHCLQSMEIYNNSVICYSLGNFCFGANKNPSKKESAIYQQTFTFVDGVLQTDIDAQIIPVTVSGHTSYNDYQPTIADDETAATIISHVNSYTSSITDSVYIDEDGRLIATDNTADAEDEVSEVESSEDGDI